MRVLLVAAPLLIFACTQAPKPADAPRPQISAAHVPAPQGTATLLVGAIDDYPVVMHLDIDGQHATGHYLYTKFGKPIALSGTLDARQHWQLHESVKGAATGHFDVVLTDGRLSGQWSTKADMSNPLPVALDVLGVPYQPHHPLAQRLDGRYTSTHASMVNEGRDASGEPQAKEASVTDEMAVRYLGDGHFAFWISVLGHYGSSGEVHGLAQIDPDLQARTLMEDCDIRFDFSKAGSVFVSEEHCIQHHGAHAYFTGNFQRKR